MKNARKKRTCTKLIFTVGSAISKAMSPMKHNSRSKTMLFPISTTTSFLSGKV